MSTPPYPDGMVITRVGSGSRIRISQICFIMLPVIKGGWHGILIVFFGI